MFSHEGSGRNEPLIPRTASFDSNSAQKALQGAASKASAIAIAVCQGEEAAVKLACILGCLSGLAIGLLGVLNPLAVISPLHLLTCIYLLAFSLVALALECGDVPVLEPFRQWVSEWLRGLTRLTGRGCMYLVLGSLASGLGDPLALLAGLVLIGAGASCLWFVSRPATLGAADDEAPGEAAVRRSTSSGGAPFDASLQAPRIAFQRRVLFGMQRMDSAELMALCLELGEKLEPRARMAALSQLDPKQTGFIDEESFVQWWAQQH